CLNVHRPQCVLSGDEAQVFIIVTNAPPEFGAIFSGRVDQLIYRHAICCCLPCSPGRALIGFRLPSLREQLPGRRLGIGVSNVCNSMYRVVAKDREINALSKEVSMLKQGSRPSATRRNQSSPLPITYSVDPVRV